MKSKGLAKGVYMGVEYLDTEEKQYAEDNTVYIDSILDIEKMLEHMDYSELNYVKKVCDMLVARQNL